MNRLEALHRYAIRRDKEGKERLNLLAPVILPTTSRLLKTVGLRQGNGCLDVGCGGGRVSFLTTNTVAPAGKVVGTDTDKEIIELRKDNSEIANTGNAEFPQVDALSLLQECGLRGKLGV